MIDWIKTSEKAPKEGVLILVSNGTYVEILYIKKGRCIKPWKYDDYDTPTFTDTSEIKYWCGIENMSAEEEKP